MSLSLPSITIDHYVSIFRHLDNASKKMLAIKILESMEVQKEQSANITSLFGSWEDSKSADEIINFLKESRVEKANLENF
jgi:hypothetical protein